MARLDGRPYPAGHYPVVVVGSGPGGLQASYSLRRLGVDHAAISQDEAPGGMFRRFPIFQRLLSWTKPEAPKQRGTREYEWYDHNSLLGDGPDERDIVADLMDRTHMVPSRPEMERGLAEFARRGGVAFRYGCRWESTRVDDDGIVLTTSDGEYRCRAAVFAPGVTDPWRPPIPGVDLVPHYAECRRAEDYAGKRVVILGKRNSGFEIADSLEPWARQIVLVSPRPVQAAITALASIRARYLQPYEDASWGGGTFVLDAAVQRIERTETGWRAHARGTTHDVDLVLEADEIIAATGFRTPVQDLAGLGLDMVAQGRIPALTPMWESTTLAGVYFAGNASQGAPGLRRHGVGSSSIAVGGFRYNARLLARHLAEKLGKERSQPPLRREEVVPFLLRELEASPELWSQKGYLAEVVTLDPPARAGVQPLAHFVDEPGPAALAATIEMNAEGAIYPVVYRRRGTRIDELVLPPHSLHRYADPEYERALRAFV